MNRNRIMKFHIIIPARYESSRLPRKLVLTQSGMPLINHTLLKAIQIINGAPGVFTGVTVACDHQEILNAVNQLKNSYPAEPVNAVMTRLDHQSGSDRIAEAAELTGLTDLTIINLQGDEPEIPAETVIGFADYITSIEDFTMATMAYPIAERSSISNPNLVKVVTDNNSNALYFSRASIPHDRQSQDGVFSGSLGHIGIYAYKAEILKKFVSLQQGKLERLEKLEQLRALENNISIAVQVLPQALPKGIDTAQDYNDFLSRIRAKL